MIEKYTSNRCEKELEKYYRSLEALKESSVNCEIKIKATKQLVKLISDGKLAQIELNIRDLGDEDFINMACVAMQSSVLNLLSDEDGYSCYSISDKKILLENFSRQDLQKILFHMLSKREYRLSEEVVWWSINIKLNVLYNSVGDKLSQIGADIEKIDNGIEGKVELQRYFNEFKQEMKSRILSKREQDIEGCQQQCIQSFLKNLHDRPDDHLGFDPERRLSSVISALRNTGFALDLREMDLRSIGQYFKKIDINGVDILLTAEQEDAYLSQEQRLTRSYRIFKLVEEGDIEQIKTLCLKVGKKAINIENSQGRTPLMLACISLKVDMVRSLLELGANPNMETKSAYKIIEGLLDLPDCKERTEIFQLLRDYGADCSELNVAAGIIDLSEAKLFCASEAINQLKKGNAPIHIAVTNGKIENVKWLLGKGADINLINTYNAAPLHLACDGGYEDIALLLLEKGADYAVKWAGETPLCIALRKNCKKIAEELIHKGAVLDLGETKKIPADVKSKFITYAFLAEVASLAKISARELLVSNVIQQNLVNFIKISTTQEHKKIILHPLSLECFINFESVKDLEDFHRHYTSHYANLIITYSQPQKGVEQVHFEFDGSILYEAILPMFKDKYKEKAKEKEEGCLVM